MTAPTHAERVSVLAVVTEGLNNQRQLTTRRAFGFRTFDAVKASLDYNLAALPEPEFTHRFC
jgi:hypothetical protein